MLTTVHQPLSLNPALGILASRMGQIDVQIQEELAHCGVLSIQLDREAEVWVGVDQRLRPSLSKTSFKVLVVVEPPDVQNLCTDGFDMVLSWHASQLTLPAARLFIAAAPWLLPTEWGDLQTKKQRGIGFLRGAKTTTEGHRIRHNLWNAMHGLQMPLPTIFIEGGVSRAERNRQFLGQFVVVIENSSHPNYFTEKLLDALLCQCVPLYWGCTNIGDFFDVSGIVMLEGDIDDILGTLLSLSDNDFSCRREAAQRNCDLAQSYGGDFGKRVQRAIETSLPEKGCERCVCFVSSYAV